MFNYEIIYRRKQHYVTIPQRRNRKLYFNSNYLNKMVSHQKNNEDMFITKYATDGIVSCIILDFDDDSENHNRAYKDAKRLRKCVFAETMRRSKKKGFTYEKQQKSPSAHVGDRRRWDVGLLDHLAYDHRDAYQGRIAPKSPSRGGENEK